MLRNENERKRMEKGTEEYNQRSNNYDTILVYTTELAK